MSILSRCRSWFHSVVHRSRWEGAKDNEVRFYIEHQTADLVRGGKTPTEASRRVRIESALSRRGRMRCVRRSACA